MFIWPIKRFWEDTPLQWVCKVIWNLSELFCIKLPFADKVFEVIMGKKGKRVN